jgi:hypothetical protein
MMTESTARKAGPTEEQLVYANLLEKGMLAGLIGLLVTFIIYVLGILPALIPKKDIPNYWTHSVHDYLHHTGAPAGWNWIMELGKGDMLNFAPIAFLGAVTIFCFLRVIPTLFRKKDTLYGFLAIIEVLVLVVAASGVLGVGGH